MLRSISLLDADVSYDPGFLEGPDADDFLAQLRKELNWEQRSIKMFGRSVPQPRLTAWYGDLDYTYSGLRWVARQWPTQT